MTRRKSSGHTMKCGLCREVLAPEEPTVWRDGKEVCIDCQKKAASFVRVEVAKAKIFQYRDNTAVT
jgi:hypothetical protein